MKSGSEMSVRDALLARGLDLPEGELEKVDTNFRRLKAIYASIQDWTPPVGTGGGR